MPPLQHSANPNCPDIIAARGRAPLKFFRLVFALSIPFWLIGAVIRLQLLAGLPVSSLMVCCPLMAALISCLQREESCRRDRTAEESLRLQANQREDLVRSHYSCNAGRHVPDVCTNTTGSQNEQNAVELFCGITLFRARPTGEALRGI
jgi:hypothetical protein